MTSEGAVDPPGGPRCSDLSVAAGEPMTGTAPRADVWVVVEHPPGWGDAPLARSGHGVRILMARGRRVPARTSDSAGARVWVAYAAGTPTLRVGLIEQAEDVAGWDLAAIARGSLRGWGRPDPDPLLLVCANGRRDRCCGHAGGRLADTLWRGPLADRVLTCTHLGGHRFAPTALLLPVGALHGRLDAPAAAGLLTDAATGRMRADTLRGFSTLESPAQVAEAHARTLTGHWGVDPLEVDVVPGRDADHVTAGVLVPAARDLTWSVAVRLERTTGHAQLACGRDPEPSTRWHLT